MLSGNVTSLRLVLDWDMVMQRFAPDQPCGPAIDPEILSLSKEAIRLLWDRHKRWNALFAELSHADAASRVDHELDMRLIEREGLAVWKRIREELGRSCEVFYYSEILHTTFASPQEYEKAIDPA